MPNTNVTNSAFNIDGIRASQHLPKVQNTLLVFAPPFFSDHPTQLSGHRQHSERAYNPQRVRTRQTDRASLCVWRVGWGIFSAAFCLRKVPI